jgi:FMN phosphatase YigB (HAD superfamily)
VRQIPLSGRVVFVDWHGVLSRDPFWVSIRESSTHPLRGQLDAHLAHVFSPETNIANDWMKGLLSSEQVINAMDIRLDRRFREDFLAQRLLVDCQKMRVNVDLFKALRHIKSTAMIVLATDNMDCFQQTFTRVRRRARKPKAASETLADWAVICDDIVCSSEVGALKAEDPVAFFGDFLARHGLSFGDAALVDDRADNCQAFAEQGGASVQYKMTTGEVNYVLATLLGWLDAASS